MLTINDTYEAKYVIKSDATTAVERVVLKTSATSISGLDNVLYELFNGNQITHMNVVVEEDITNSPRSYNINNILPVAQENLNNGRYEVKFEGFTLTTNGLTVKSDTIGRLKVTPTVYFENNIVGQAVDYIELGTYYVTAEDNLELDINDEIWVKINFSFTKV